MKITTTLTRCFLNFSNAHHCNGRYLLRLAVPHAAVPAVPRQLDTNVRRRGIMDSLHHDPLLRAHASPSRLLRRPIREEDNPTSWSHSLHPRLGASHRRQVRGPTVRRTDVLRAGLRHRVHCRSNVHGRNRHKRSSRRSLHSHHLNE